MFKVKNKFKTKHYEKEFNGEINVDVYNPEVTIKSIF